MCVVVAVVVVDVVLVLVLLLSLLFWSVVLFLHSITSLSRFPVFIHSLTKFFRRGAFIYLRHRPTLMKKKSRPLLSQAIKCSRAYFTSLQKHISRNRCSARLKCIVDLLPTYPSSSSSAPFLLLRPPLATACLMEPSYRHPLGSCSRTGNYRGLAFFL